MTTLFVKWTFCIFMLIAVLLHISFGLSVSAVHIEHVIEQAMTFKFGEDHERTGLYTGPVEDGLAHGHGRFEWTNPKNEFFIHEGEFVNGAIQGRGTRKMQSPKGHEAKWEGKFQNGLFVYTFKWVHLIIVISTAVALAASVFAILRFLCRKKSKATFGNALFFSSILYPFTALIPVYFSYSFLDILRNNVMFVLYLSALGFITIAGIVFSAHIRVEGAGVTKARVFVVSRSKAGKRGSLIGDIVFEKESGEFMEICANMMNHNSLSEGDVGIVHYRTLTGKVDKMILNSMLFKPDGDGNIKELIKFEREGKSASLSDKTAQEHCKNCGAAIDYGKFSVQGDCKYCVKSNAANDKTIPAGIANMKMQIGNFIFIVSILVFVMSVFFLVLIPILDLGLQGFTDFFSITAVISFFTFFVGLLLWHGALPVIKVRALVKRKGSLGALLGEITFETEKGESMTLSDVDTEKYPLISEGEVGILHYKLSEKNAKSFIDFISAGKSIALSYTTANIRCKNCGASVSVEKHKFNTKIICEYCNSIDL